jgi:SPP1 gp7 family putative phage head morphogenesis protein
MRGPDDDRRRPPGWEEARRRWQRIMRADRQYGVQLRRLARTIGDIVHGLWRGPGESTSEIETTLRHYSTMVGPWARSVAERMLVDVARRDETAWYEISRGLRHTVASAPIRPAITDLLEAEVGLITAMPLDAEARIRDLAREAVTGGRRWEEVAEDILSQHQVSTARANLIARTETGRAATVITEARAVHVGSPGYIWRTARDSRVRPLHRELEGTFHAWNDPPVSGEHGELAHPGAIYNCRCFPEIIVGDTDIARKQGVRPRNPAFLAALRAAGYSSGAAFE